MHHPMLKIPTKSNMLFFVVMGPSLLNWLLQRNSLKIFLSSKFHSQVHHVQNTSFITLLTWRCWGWQKNLVCLLGVTINNDWFKFEMQIIVLSRYILNCFIKMHSNFYCMMPQIYLFIIYLDGGCSPVMPIGQLDYLWVVWTGHAALA